jgi:tetratricopeptide (TPR) repeat protein
MSLAQAGNLNRARQEAEQVLGAGKGADILPGLLGMICCRAGELDAGISYLRQAHAHNPNDAAVLSNLANALTQKGDFVDALALLPDPALSRDPSGRLLRLRAYLRQQTDQFGDAAADYKAIVSAQPDDFEAWNNLGNALAAAGETEESLAAIKKAIVLRPDVAPLRINLATTMLEAGKPEEAVALLEKALSDFPSDTHVMVELAALYKHQQRDDDMLAMMERATGVAPDDADLFVKYGMELVSLWHMDRAEQAFSRAIALNARHAEAQILKALLLEHTNQVEQLPNLLEAGTAAEVDAGTLAFIRALLARRNKEFAEGLAALEEVPANIEPIRQSQLRGQFLDRLGQAGAAFDAFSEMNSQHKADASDPMGRASHYRAALREERDLVSADWFASWEQRQVDGAIKSPVFLVGFPRSGTTLLDTFLMGHPQAQVMEEKPPLNLINQTLGGLNRLATLPQVELDALRQDYFNAASEWAACGDGELLIDKSPLHMNKVPLAHRLFPDAKYILALRHPCDVVLSCFMTNFRLNTAMSNFIDLQTAAECYDLSFSHWEKCRSIFPIQVHEVSYEAMVDDKEAELRRLFEFLGLSWHEEALDHQKTAVARGTISTASYAQVTERIYTRAAGRWTNYRDELEPVLPILEPWVRRFGYEL